MTDEMMHAEMAALYAQQRVTQVKAPDAHLESLLPPELYASVQHYAAARDFTAKQALFHIVSKFFGPCSKSPQSATSPLIPKPAR